MITAAIESVTDALNANEIQPLFPAHWEELGLWRDKVPLDPRYQEYFEHDAHGRVVYAALREDGVVKGYFVGFVQAALHYQTTLMCRMDIAYVTPELRLGGAGKLLFDTIKRELLRRGVKMWWVGSKDHHPIEQFYEALGFERVESHYALWLGDEHV